MELPERFERIWSRCFEHVHSFWIRYGYGGNATYPQRRAECVDRKRKICHILLQSELHTILKNKSLDIPKHSRIV